MKKFLDVLGRYKKRQLSALEAGQIMGCSERQFRRWQDRYEEEGLDGLVDKRPGQGVSEACAGRTSRHQQRPWRCAQQATPGSEIQPPSERTTNAPGRSAMELQIGFAQPGTGMPAPAIRMTMGSAMGASGRHDRRICRQQQLQPMVSIIFCVSLSALFNASRLAR